MGLSVGYVLRQGPLYPSSEGVELVGPGWGQLDRTAGLFSCPSMALGWTLW